VIALVRITAENVSTFKATRLVALRDAPYAFGSTYAEETQLSDADWLARAARWNGVRGVGLMAMDGGSGCGIAGSFIDEDDPSRARLVSMWTAPTHREAGVGRLLVDGIVVWAREKGVRVLQLMVTSNNEAALRFYERLGFSRTGRTEPYPNDPTVVEYEMSRQL
jgi:ribosomal protein S18 acetylase RimI-like enzyme